MNELFLNSLTFRLFSLPDFSEGAGSILDLHGTYKNYHCDKTPEEADINALRDDMLETANDFKMSLEVIKKEASIIE